MKKQTKIILKTGLITVCTLLGMFFLYFFYLFVTVEGKIVEGRPLQEFICDVRPLCGVGSGATWPCEGLDEALKNGRLSRNSSPNAYELSRWAGYKGCNESTNGYIEITKDTGRVNKRITGIETCWCEGFFG